ncbi:hypothetical protein MRX96_041520 [Rhipicephalus microplus]
MIVAVMARVFSGGYAVENTLFKVTILNDKNVLHILEVNETTQGRYVCKATNEAGERVTECFVTIGETEQTVDLESKARPKEEKPKEAPVVEEIIILEKEEKPREVTTEATEIPDITDVKTVQHTDIVTESLERPKEIAQVEYKTEEVVEETETIELAKVPKPKKPKKKKKPEEEVPIVEETEQTVDLESKARPKEEQPKEAPVVEEIIILEKEEKPREITTEATEIPDITDVKTVQRTDIVTESLEKPKEIAQVEYKTEEVVEETETIELAKHTDIVTESLERPKEISEVEYKTEEVVKETETMDLVKAPKQKKLKKKKKPEEEVSVFEDIVQTYDVESKEVPQGKIPEEIEDITVIKEITVFNKKTVETVTETKNVLQTEFTQSLVSEELVVSEIPEATSAHISLVESRPVVIEEISSELNTDELESDRKPKEERPQAALTESKAVTIEEAFASEMPEAVSVPQQETHEASQSIIIEEKSLVVEETTSEQYASEFLAKAPTKRQKAKEVLEPQQPIEVLEAETLLSTEELKALPKEKYQKALGMLEEQSLAVRDVGEEEIAPEFAPDDVFSKEASKTLLLFPQHQIDVTEVIPGAATEELIIEETVKKKGNVTYVEESREVSAILEEVPSEFQPADIPTKTLTSRITDTARSYPQYEEQAAEFYEGIPMLAHADQSRVEFERSAPAVHELATEFLASVDRESTASVSHVEIPREVTTTEEMAAHFDITSPEKTHLTAEFTQFPRDTVEVHEQAMEFKADRVLPLRPGSTNIGDVKSYVASEEIAPLFEAPSAKEETLQKDIVDVRRETLFIEEIQTEEQTHEADLTVIPEKKSAQPSKVLPAEHLSIQVSEVTPDHGRRRASN